MPVVVGFYNECVHGNKVVYMCDGPKYIRISFKCHINTNKLTLNMYILDVNVFPSVSLNFRYNVVLYPAVKVTDLR